jgi:hypothetical protein
LADEPEPQEEEGLIDLTESIQADVVLINSTLGRMAQAINDVGDHVRSGGAALDALRDSGNVDTARIKRVINRSAEDVETFAKRIDAEVPIFAEVYERMVRSVAKAAVLRADLESGEDPMSTAATAVETLTVNMKGAKQGAEGMRDAITAWPRMTTALNRARRRGAAALDKLISEYQRAIDVAEVVVSSLREKP